MFFLPGHLLSTAEVESALVEHKAVAEAAVVGRPHPIKGESLYCFVTLTNGVTYNQKLEAELKKQGCTAFHKMFFCPIFRSLQSFHNSIIASLAGFT